MKKIGSLLLCLLVAFGFASCGESSSGTAGTFSPDVLSVDFIDVGQGDAILLSCGGESILVDAGTNESGKTVVDYISSKKISRLKYAVATHPHADHIGGLDDVIENVEIDDLLMPDVTAETATFSDVLDAAEEKNLSITVPSRGDVFPLGNAAVTVLTDTKKNFGDELNNYSLVLKASLGKFSVMLTGDAETQAEDDILKSGEAVSASVLKVGHHGSRTSTGENFLKAVSPKAAVISCGKDNDYGHPHAETLKKLEKSGVAVYRTDILGTISVLGRENGEFEFLQSTVQPTVSTEEQSTAPSEEATYILNTNSKKFHKPDCKNAADISEKNRKEFFGERQQLINEGYSPCKSCNP